MNHLLITAGILVTVIAPLLVLYLRGDLFHIALTVGDLALWTFLALSMAFALYAIVVVIDRFKGSPQEAAEAAA
ncbi:MAG: hypothetical protein IPI01_15510 [Ignavibacteriae bacterium]|nr:hypothetical protein [Ignavibacteriota bacterium]